MSYILKLLAPENVTAYWEKEKEMQDYLGNTFFPAVKTGKLTLRHLRGASGYPVVLEPSAFDAKPNLRGRKGFTRVEHDMPFFREAMQVKEKDLMDLHSAITSSDKDTARFIVEHIYDDVGQLKRGALARIEQMKWDIIQTGGFVAEASSEHGRDALYEFSYDPDGTWKTNNVVELTGTSTWDNHDSSDPIADIQAVLRTAKAKNTTISEIVLNSETLNDILSNELASILLNPQGVFMVDDELKSSIEKKLNVKFIVYDDQFGFLEDGVEKTEYFLKTGKVIFKPAGAVGRFIFGVTPEEIGVIQSPHSQKTIFNTGITLVQYQESSSVVNNFFNVSFLGMPDFQQMDKVYILETREA